MNDRISIKNMFNNFLLSLSKTDKHILGDSTEEARKTQLSIGGKVLFTGISAFAPSYFALTSVFGENFYNILISSVYCFGIIIFDREIVLAFEKGAVILRIPFAILIGIVISFPREMRFLREELTRKLIMAYRKRIILFLLY